MVRREAEIGGLELSGSQTSSLYFLVHKMEGSALYGYRRVTCAGTHRA